MAWIVAVHASLDQLSLGQGVVVCHCAGAVAALTVSVCIALVAYADGVAQEYAWAEAVAVCCAVATLPCRAAVSVALLGAAVASPAGREVGAARPCAGFQGAGHDSPRTAISPRSTFREQGLRVAIADSAAV